MILNYQPFRLGLDIIENGIEEIIHALEAQKSFLCKASLNFQAVEWHPKLCWTLSPLKTTEGTEFLIWCFRFLFWSKLGSAQIFSCLFKLNTAFTNPQTFQQARAVFINCRSQLFSIVVQNNCQHMELISTIGSSHHTSLCT